MKSDSNNINDIYIDDFCLDTLDVPAAEKAVTTVQEMTNYFTKHANKREFILNQIFKIMEPQSKRKKCMKKCCKTRWTPKFYSWRSFLENIKVIEITLRVLSGKYSYF